VRFFICSHRHSDAKILLDHYQGPRQRNLQRVLQDGPAKRKKEEKAALNGKIRRIPDLKILSDRRWRLLEGGKKLEWRGQRNPTHLGDKRLPAGGETNGVGSGEEIAFMHNK